MIWLDPAVVADVVGAATVAEVVAAAFPVPVSEKIDIMDSIEVGGDDEEGRGGELGGDD